ADAAGEVAEVVGRQRDVGVQCLAHRLAVVPGFGDGELFQVGFDAIGDLQQDQRTGLHAGLAPGVRGGVGGVQRLFDVGGVGAGEFADDRTIDRAGIDEVFTVDWGGEFATDVVAVARFEGQDGARRTGFCVNHDGDLSCGVGRGSTLTRSVLRAA